MTIRTVLLSLQALLATPEPDDPQDAGNVHRLDSIISSI
jgi:ubiquitin-protein ligase